MPLNIWKVDADGNYSTAGNWSLAAVPTTADDVLIPAGSPAITAGFNQSGVTIRSFTREKGHTAAIGDVQNYLRLTVDGTGSFIDLNGTGSAFLDFGSSTSPIAIRGSGNGTNGYGFYIKGTGLEQLIIEGGNIYFVAAEIDDIDVRGGSAFFDRDCVINASGVLLANSAGIVTTECALRDVRSRGGQIVINGTGAVNSILADGGTVTCNTTGTVTLAQADGKGIIDFTKALLTRAVTTVSVSGTGTILLDPDLVTVTNWQADGSVKFALA